MRPRLLIHNTASPKNMWLEWLSVLDPFLGLPQQVEEKHHDWYFVIEIRYHTDKQHYLHLWHLNQRRLLVTCALPLSSCSESPLERVPPLRPSRLDCCSTSAYASCGYWSWGGHPTFTDNSLDWCNMSNASLGFQVKEHSKDTTERRVCRIIHCNGADDIWRRCTGARKDLNLRVGARESWWITRQSLVGWTQQLQNVILVMSQVICTQQNQGSTQWD